MRTLFVQTLRELRSIFHTPVAYVVMTIFLAMIGFNFYSAVVLLSGKDYPVTVMEVTFINVLFIFMFAFTTSLITMRLFAEEYRMGTIEMLTTAPIHEWQIVVSKFASAILFYAIILTPTLLFFWIFGLVSNGVPVAKSPGAIASMYLIIMLIVMLFVSIGLLASSLVRDQVNAAVISLVANILYIFLPQMLTHVMPTVTDPRFRKAVAFVSPVAHMESFSKGLVDTRPLIWYVSASLFFVFLTNHIFHSRKLQS